MPSKPITVLSAYESLNCVLLRLGLTKSHGRNGISSILRGEESVFRGRVDEVWQWLEQSGQIEFSEWTSPEYDAARAALNFVCALAKYAKGAVMVRRGEVVRAK